jgi:DNA-directed RNA polymerase II subunit RPB1
MAECPGHFGHIELARPVFHAGFMVKVKKILECICVNCGKLKVDMSDPEVNDIARRVKAQHRLKRIWERAKSVKECKPDDAPDEGADPDDIVPGHGGCGHKQPDIRKEALKLYANYKLEKDEDADRDTKAETDKQLLQPSQVLNILRKIPSQDLLVMGLSEEFARPDWMILTILPVPPATVRPSVQQGAGQRSEDDLTHKLFDIIRSSSTVRRLEQEGAPAHIVNEHFDMLQYHVATFMDNDIAGIPQAMQKSGRPIKAIRARLKGKEGRLRGNLMGKRVDFSARTVITGDPNLQLDQVGVPKSIAMTLTYPERGELRDPSAWSTY